MKDMLSQQSNMIAKLIAMQETKLLVCNKCNSSTESTNNLENHNRTHHVSRAIQCLMCDYNNMSEAIMNKHIADQHPEKYRCTKCQNEFSTSQKLKSHMQSSHTSNKGSTAEIVEIEDTDEVPEWSLIVGDSHVKSLNMRKLEGALKGKKLSNPASSRPSEASAYTTSKYWPNAKYPSSNLEDRLPKLLNEKKYSNLIVRTPSNNITNIEDMPKDQQDMMAVDTPLETLAMVEKALKDNKSLKKAVIIELPPRTDNDRLSELTEFSNFVLKEAANKSKYRNQISIGALDTMYDYNERDIFGSPNYHKYDGIHMHGKLGRKVYSNCVVAALESAGLTSAESTPAYIPISTSNRYSVLSN